jgi:hypothetical protein
MPAPLLPLLIAAGAAAFALSKKSTPNKSGIVDGKAGLPGGGPAASTLPGADKTPPADILKTIAAALQSANPVAMRASADIVEKAGFAAQAADLRAAALAIEKATTSSPGVINTTGTTVLPPVQLPNASVPVSPPATSPATNPNTGSTINLPEIVITGNNPKKDQAAKLALMLGTTKRFKENKEQVRAFQTANLSEEQKSQAILKKPGNAATDGLYGTTTALTLARVYGIVPPAPFYYPTNPTPAKKAYQAEMAKFAVADPQRADEWNHAGQSVTNM